jgi:cytochrome b
MDHVLILKLIEDDCMIIKKYIYDKTTRILHASIGISVVLLFVSAKIAKIFFEYNSLRIFLWNLHLTLGYLLGFLFLYRFVWFFLGNDYAKVKNFLHFEEIFKAFKNRQKIEWKFGHHPLAGMVYLAFYLLLISIVVSGLYLARIEHDLGPIAEKYFDDMNAYAQIISIHEVISNLILGFFILHIIALFKHQMNDGVPVITSMKDGYQYKKIKGENNEETINGL